MPVKTVLKIVVGATLILVLAALLAPPVYWLGRALVTHGIVPALASVKFHSYFNRTALILGLAGLWPLLRWLGVRHIADLQLSANPRRFADIGLGFIIGAGGFTLVLALLAMGGYVRLRATLPWGDAWMFFLTALVVPLIEEPFFRGALFGSLRRAMPWPWALAFLSFFFAILHFLGPRPGGPKVSGEQWTAGFRLVGQLFWQFAEPQRVAWGWVTLFLVGWALGYTVVKTRSLYLALGLHSGWVLAMRFYDEFMRRPIKTTSWIGKDVRMGVAPVLLLAATVLLLILILGRRATPGASTPPQESKP